MPKYAITIKNKADKFDKTISAFIQAQGTPDEEKLRAEQWGKKQAEVWGMNPDKTKITVAPIVEAPPASVTSSKIEVIITCPHCGKTTRASRPCRHCGNTTFPSVSDIKWQKSHGGEQ